MTEKSPSYFQSREKESELYISQIDEHAKEKALHIHQLLSEQKLPEIGNKIRLLEVGVGSGAAFKELSKTFEAQSNIDYIGLDRSEALANYFTTRTGLPSLVGDAGNLPFPNESFSAVNVSAVLHEVSSYGTVNDSGMQIGILAVEQVISESARIIVKGGAFAYRDVFCPENTGPKTVLYTQPSWSIFVETFLERFLPFAIKVDASRFGNCTVNKVDRGCEITGSQSVQREIQRHYLMFRDFFRKTVLPTSNIKVLREDWVSVEEGVKAHTISIPKTLQDWILVDFLKQHSGKELTIESSDYDNLTDKLIYLYLKSGNTSEYSDWLKREGGEVYTYATLTELSEIAKRYGLVEETESRVLIPRDYYQRYLAEVISDPEFEGKQATVFIKK